MSEGRDLAGEALDRAHDAGWNVLARLVAVASADKVFGAPVVAGDRTVITAAEIHTGLGFGYGYASDDVVHGRPPDEPETKARVVSWGRGRRKGHGKPQGGGGGGGQASGRPVAVVTIDPEGVHVHPVIDRTKIALAAITALGAISLALIRSRQAAKRRRRDSAGGLAVGVSPEGASSARVPRLRR